MIVGLTRCEHGEIYLDNRDISRIALHRRAQLGLGYLPQEPSGFRPLVGAHNIMAIFEKPPGPDEGGRTPRPKELFWGVHYWLVLGSPGIRLFRGGRPPV